MGNEKLQQVWKDEVFLASGSKPMIILAAWICSEWFCCVASRTYQEWWNMSTNDLFKKGCCDILLARTSKDRNSWYGNRGMKRELQKILWVKKEWKALAWHVNDKIQLRNLRVLIHQGCILSPCLFNLYAEYIMRNAGLEETQAGIKIAGRNIKNLRYAGDTTLWQKANN